ncbi:hypothetical protein lerEdw1_012553 [Lerista edwardsae]|nr:hypothetical protein lerEdw1_012553 [Lerista edwardsae]
MAAMGTPLPTGGLQGFLLQLHGILRSPEPAIVALHGPSLIRSLAETCVTSGGDAARALQTSLIFSKEDGLLSFIHKSLAAEEFRECREEALKFLCAFLEKIGLQVHPYALDIKLLQNLRSSYVMEDMKVAEIFNKFYGELAVKSKVPDTVLERIYELLGILGEVQPSDMLENSEKLFRAYLGELKTQMTSTVREPKFPIVAGCLKGLTALMYNFTKSMDEDPQTSKEIFDFALKAINPQIDLKRYAVLVAGLHLFSMHAAQFTPCLLDNYISLYEIMSKWCGHQNAELKKAGHSALDAFLKQISAVVAKDAEMHKNKLRFFMEQFYGIIRKIDASNKDLSIAIRGYGLFAASCKAINSKDVDIMYVELLQRCKQMYLTEAESIDDHMYQLPSFLQSIASVIFHLDTIPEVYTPVLERLVVVQIESFPQYSVKMQSVCCKSIVKVFLALAGKGPVLWSFMSTVGKAVSSTEEAPTPGEVRTGKWKVPTYKDYLDLFRSLLSCDTMKDSLLADESFPITNSPLQSLNRLFYDELIRSILKIIEKLDLTVQKQNVNEEKDGNEQDVDFIIPTSDPTANLQPIKPKDFTAFINLVEFSREILPEKHTEYFAPWVYSFGYELIIQSTQLPLISGFYKLLSIAMKIAKKIKYFEGVSPTSKIKCPDPEKSSCFALFTKFGKEVTAKMKQYKDELLASCLTFVLSLPHDIVMLDVKAYIPALQNAFKLGLSHTPMADVALDALEDWSARIPRYAVQPYYKDILPLLDGYLQTSVSTDDSQNNLEVKKLSRAVQKGLNKVIIQHLKKAKSLVLEEDLSMEAVRTRVIRILGSLGGQVNRNLVTAASAEEKMKKFVSWDTEKHLSFAVPFVDMKPVIYLDVFLPRVTELALSASDRQTKVTRQLYEPLVMELIHWFTNNKKFESQDTVALLEAILDGIVDPVDSTLRDFCGQCVREFLKWSIKQTTPQQQENSPVNTKSLFKRLYSLALHPNAFKRLGAALAFNNIYREFREENALVDQFVFEALVVFLESLALTHGDEKSLGTTQQCCDAVDHLKRIIKHKASTLNKESNRRVPRGFPPGKPVCLVDIVMWLFTQCGRPQTECRHKVMELFFEFVPLLPGSYIAAIVKFEGGGSEGENVSGILTHPTLHDLQGTFSLQAVGQWMDMLLAALDCYNTFIEQGMIRAHEVLAQFFQATNIGSSFLTSLEFFLEKICLDDVSGAEQCFSAGSKSNMFSPQEKEEYSYKKCTIIVRVMVFVSMILETHHLDFWKLLEKQLLNENLIKLLVKTVCDPQTIGFNVADVQVMQKLPDICVRLVKAFMKSPYKESLESSIKKIITSKSIEELRSVELFNPEARLDHVRLAAILSACKQLHKAGLLHSVLHSQGTDLRRQTGSKLVLVVYKGIAPGDERKSLPLLDVSSKRLAEGLLQLAFAFGVQCTELVSLLLNTLTLSVPLSGASQRDLINFSHGEYFYNLFSETINRELLENLDIAVLQLMESSQDSPRMVGTILNGMLDQSFRDRAVRKQQGVKLVTAILKNWAYLDSWWTKDSSPESKMAVLTLLAKILQIDSSVSSNTHHEAFSVVFKTYTSLLTDQSLGLNLKGSDFRFLLASVETRPQDLPALGLQSQAIIILPFFTNLVGEKLGDLKNALDQLVVLHFPLRSDEFPKGTLRYNNYVDCTKKFQDALELSQSPMLLQLMTEIFCRDHRHIMEELFEISFRRMVKRGGCDKQVVLLDTVHKMFQSETLLSNATRQAYVDRCLLLLLQHCSLEALKVFLSKVIVEAMDSLKSRFTKSNETAFEMQLVKKMSYFKILEVMYSRLSKEDVYSKDSLINQAFQGSSSVEGNELTKTLIKSCYDAFTENMSGETQLLEKRRQYHCAAYNCAIAVISCVFNESKFYHGFLFTEKPEKSLLIFENLLDLEHRYLFPIEVEETTESMVPDDVMELEMDELNQHECMASMTTLIKHMQRNNITPTVKTDEISPGLPPWMKFLHGKLGNPSVPLNIRLFVAKLIVNTEEVFQPYAKHWLGPLLQLIVSGDNGGEGIHYMVVEIVVTLLSWTSIATPKGNIKDEVLANRLLEFLMKNAFHQKRAVFKHNLEIIKTVVECWRDCLSIPYRVIFDRFSGADPKTKDNSVGIQLLGIVLANNLPPYDPKCEIDSVRYFQALAKNLGFIQFKEIYAAAAEVLGLVLQYVAQKENIFEGPIYDLVIKQLQQHQNSKEDKFIVCLNKVTKNFPPLADRFMNTVFFLIPKLHGVMKTYCLEVVMCRAQEIADLYLLLKSKDFTQIMNHRDDERQIVCLDIVYKMLPKLKPAEVQELLPSVTSFISHPSPLCRGRMYDILMWIYDNYRDPESQADPESSDVFKLVKEALLQGLIDDNSGLQLIVRNFWSDETRLPANTLDRMLTLLNSLYSAKIETQYLSLATDFLLEMTSKSPDYSRKMFEYPLSECKFQDFAIDSDWRYRSTVLTPLFVETQASQNTGSRLIDCQLLQEMKSQLKMKRDAQVTLYRKYRQGDLPDIQIEYRSLITPLQGVAQRDPALAKLLFSSLFSGILKEMNKSKSKLEESIIIQQLVQDFNRFLTTSVLFFPPFISCIQEMSYQHKELLDLNPSSVSSSCLASLQQPVGILLLEQGLICLSPEEEEPPSKRKRGKTALSPDVNRWIELAKLYRSVGNYDVLRDIFSGKIGTKEITEKALLAEAKSDYAEAAKNYEEETYLPYIIRSKLKLLLHGGDDQTLLTFIDEAMKTEQKKALIEMYYSQELSLLYLLQDDFDRAKYYVKNAMQVFVQNYSTIDSLLHQSRLTKLQSVQALTEIQDFINFISKPSNIASQSSLKRLLSIWTTRYPDAKMDPLNIWDDIITNRCFFLDKIQEKFPNTPLEDSMEVDGGGDASSKMEVDNEAEDTKSMIRSCKFTMKMKMIESARKQNSFSVAMKLLKDLHRDSKTREDWLVRWNHSYCRFSHSRSRTQSSPEQILTVLKTVSLLDETGSLSNSAHTFRNQNLLLGTTFRIMANALCKDERCLDQIEEEKARKVLALSGERPDNIYKVIAGLHKRAFQYFSNAVKKAEEEVQSLSSDHIDTNGVIDAYMTLANFCDSHLCKEGSADINAEDLKAFPAIVVEKVIKALKLNSKEARLKFPRLLQIVEKYQKETLGLMVREKFGKDFDNHFGKGGSKLLDMTAREFGNIAGSLSLKMTECQKEPGNLKECSPWMSEFKPEFLRHELEIPGQYDGKGKPLPEYHAKVSGFDERIKVMESIRKPKRIIIRGSDEREYPFLVKGGEDLRQDQRIEQLFDIMNTVLSRDAACSQRNLQLKTYQVIPMTTSSKGPRGDYGNWLSKMGEKNTGPARYPPMYKRASRTETVTSFRRRESLVPEDLLRRAFVKMSTTPEALLSLRSHFASSHALMCINHWILGIGDRHLSNFMINLETGGTVGIDFGHAFGSATQFLPVPELVPFRLTRQFVNLMLPMKESGLLHSVMVHSLRAYRADPDIIISTMDVFVKEPSLDWKNFELKQLKKGGTWTKDINTNEVNWYPLQKLNFAKRKLAGANPAVITSEELRLGHEKSAAYRDYVSVARGSKEYNVRAREPDDGLPEEMQVKCLIDQATDPNILGRTWEGWEPWM